MPGPPIFHVTFKDLAPGWSPEELRQSLEAALKVSRVHLPAGAEVIVVIREDDGCGCPCCAAWRGGK